MKKESREIRIMVGTPALQIVIGAVLDVLQMVKSERLKPRVDAGTASDRPYEAAVASIGGLVAGSAGLALFFFPRNMRLIYSYPFLCIFGAGASIFGMVQSLIVRNSVDELVHLHWAAAVFASFLTFYHLSGFYNGLANLFLIQRKLEGEKEQHYQSTFSVVSSKPLNQHSARQNGEAKIPLTSQTAQVTVKITNPSTEPPTTTETTRCLIEEKASVSVSPLPSSFSAKVQEPSISSDQVFVNKGLSKSASEVEDSALHSSFTVEPDDKNTLPSKSDSTMFNEIEVLTNAPVCRTESGFQFMSVSSSSDYVSNSASINRLAASTSNSEFVREETTLKEDPENEMNIETNSLKKDRQSPLTKQVDFGSRQNTIDSRMTFESFSLPSSPKEDSQRLSQQQNSHSQTIDENTTREDLWSTLCKILGTSTLEESPTNGSQESLLQTPTGAAADVKFDENTRKLFIYLRSLLLHLKSQGEKFDEVADKLIVRINLLDKNSSEAQTSPELGPMLAMLQFSESMRRVSKSLLEISGLHEEN